MLLFSEYFTAILFWLVFFFFCRSTIYQSTLERAITVLVSEREGEWEREEAFVCMNE